MEAMTKSADIISNRFWSKVKNDEIKLVGTGVDTAVAWPELYNGYHASAKSDDAFHIIPSPDVPNMFLVVAPNLKVSPAIPEGLMTNDNELAKFEGLAEGYFVWQEPKERERRIILI